MIKKTLVTLSLLTTVGLLSPLAYARIGVGVGTGKIQVDTELKPGTIYELPSLTVINTGDEESMYKVGIAYHEQQPEQKPPQEWFSFTPSEFNLKPGESTNVKILLNLPIKTVPADYFAYLEGFPVKKATTDGGTSIGIAAAAKLYFTVSPANFIEGIYYRLLSFWNINQPWSSRIAIGIAIVITLFMFKKFFKVELSLKKRADG